jgi:7,8-dihydroneopterin aldolase/epimerase/oxygenase
MDELFLEGLEVACRVGCTPPERAQPQSLRVDVRMFCRSIAQAARDDDLAMSVDYRVAAEMIDAVQGQEFLLIERVAETLAQVALKHAMVDAVEVSLKKRPPVQSLEWAGVRIRRERAR